MKRKQERKAGITALYERLSRDDDNVGESNSIIHQKQMLEDFATKNGFANLEHFTDDGWSGATFDRPDWNRLIEGVKSGRITTVITKDLSRIGRDHLQVGYYTDMLFNEKEVRFIAINNGIDSLRQETSEFAPFLNIMNEWYVRDTSKKIKSVLKARGMSGKAHTSNVPPYGYLKDPENPEHWVIDPEAAAVVRRIFQMAIDGKGPYTIARELAANQIERPSYYLGKKGLGNQASVYDKENPYQWRGNTVVSILARPEYIGKTVNFRTYKNSYKDKKQKRTDKENWVVFDGTQEPIVDVQTWELVQKLRGNVRKVNPMGEPNVLTGRVYCADCGAPMYNHRNSAPRRQTYYTVKGERRQTCSTPENFFECSTYNLNRQKYQQACSCHHITDAALRKVILTTIRETCSYVLLNEAAFLAELRTAEEVRSLESSKVLKGRLEQNENRLQELDQLIRKIYEDNIAGKLPDRIFQNMLADYEAEQDELTRVVKAEQAELDTIIGGEQNVERFLALVKKYQPIRELTPAMINEFVDKVLVHEGTGRGADRCVEIEIYLNYIGQFKLPAAQPEELTEEERKAREEAEEKRRKNREYMREARKRAKANAAKNAELEAPASLRTGTYG